MSIVDLVTAAAFAALSALVLLVNNYFIASRALSDLLVLVGAVLAFGALMALLPRGRR
jgi:hypothetical protein